MRSNLPDSRTAIAGAAIRRCYVKIFAAMQPASWKRRFKLHASKAVSDDFHIDRVPVDNKIRILSDLIV